MEFFLNEFKNMADIEFLLLDLPLVPGSFLEFSSAYSLGKSIRSKSKLNVLNCDHTVMNQGRYLDLWCQELLIYEVRFDITHMSIFY